MNSPRTISPSKTSNKPHVTPKIHLRSNIDINGPHDIQQYAPYFVYASIYTIPTPSPDIKQPGENVLIIGRTCKHVKTKNFLHAKLRRWGSTTLALFFVFWRDFSLKGGLVSKSPEKIASDPTYGHRFSISFQLYKRTTRHGIGFFNAQQQNSIL